MALPIVLKVLNKNGFVQLQQSFKY